MQDAPVIGLVEKVSINGFKIKARVDTGAKMSSIDKVLARKLELGPVIRKTKVKSAHGTSRRPVIKTLVKIRNKKIRASFNLADRNEMKFDILIGRNILKKGFLIDTKK